MIVMISKEKQMYDICKEIHSQIKFLLNSEFRLKIIFYLSNKSASIKSISKDFDVAYSSVFTIVHELEKDGILKQDGDSFTLANLYKIYLDNLINFYDSICFLEDKCTVINNSSLSTIPLDDFKNLMAISELQNIAHLKGLKLIESTSVDIFKTTRFVKDFLINNNEFKLILPFVPANYEDVLKCWVENKINAEFIVSDYFPEYYIKKIKENYDGNLSHFKFYKIDYIPYFLIAVSPNGFILSLFNKEKKINRKSLFYSTSQDTIDWANEYFKKVKEKGKVYNFLD